MSEKLPLTPEVKERYIAIAGKIKDLKRVKRWKGAHNMPQEAKDLWAEMSEIGRKYEIPPDLSFGVRI